MHYIKRPLKALKVIITLNSQLSIKLTLNSKLSTYYRSNNVFSSPAYASK